MDPKEFGTLVKTLRSQSTDPEGKPWSRERMAAALEISKAQLGRLERGDRKYLSNGLLQKMAECFGLTNLERREFFYAAGGLSDRDLYGDVEHLEQINGMIKLMQDLRAPSFILDVYGDLVAASGSLFGLYSFTDRLLAEARESLAGLNLVGITYSPDLPFSSIIDGVWGGTAEMAMLFFRRSTLRYRHRPYFSALLKELRKNARFDMEWFASHKLAGRDDISYEMISYDHPKLGSLSYIASETVVYTKHGELYLIIYNSITGHTTKVFEHLLGEYGSTVRRLAPWPEKPV